MHYELVSGVNTGAAAWQQQKKILQQNHLQLLVLGSSPNFAGIMQQEKIKKAVNLLDQLTKRLYQKNQYLYFNQAPVPDGTNILVNADGYITLAYYGDEIGEMKLYPGTNRAVKEIDYFYPDGTRDFVEEYATDGQQYSRLLFNDNQPQEFQFLNDHGQVVVRYYFFAGAINYITVEDPTTQEVLEHYDNQMSFTIAQATKFITAQDQVTICYMGTELMALQNTKSHNILALSEDPFDEQNEVRGNLLGILNNSIKYIQEVQMSRSAYNELALRNVDLTKAKIVD